MIAKSLRLTAHRRILQWLQSTDWRTCWIPTTQTWGGFVGKVRCTFFHPMLMNFCCSHRLIDYFDRHCSSRQITFEDGSWGVAYSIAKVYDNPYGCTAQISVLVQRDSLTRWSEDLGSMDECCSQKCLCTWNISASFQSLQIMSLGFFFQFYSVLLDGSENLVTLAHGY